MKNIPTFEEFLNESKLNEAKDLKVGQTGVDYNDTTVKILKIGKLKDLIKEWEKHNKAKAADQGLDELDGNEKFYLVEIIEDSEGGDSGDYALYPVKYDVSSYWGLDLMKESVNEGMSKSKLDQEIKDMKKDLAPEGMGYDEKFDMADAILDDPSFAAAVKKHYSPSSPQEWLASRI